MRNPSKEEQKDIRDKLGPKRPQKGSANVPGSKFVLRAESFSSWLDNRLALEAKRAPRPVQMPKGDSSKIEFRDAKERIPGGRKNTAMDSRPKRLRTRGAKKRDAMRDQDS